MAKASATERYFRDFDEDALNPDQQDEHAAADTMWVYSPTGGGFTGHNLNAMTEAQKEQLFGRIAIGEIRVAEGPDKVPSAPDEVLEARVARRAIADPAGALMAAKQGVDPQRVLQELHPDASDEIKAEYEAVRAQGDPGETPIDQILGAKQEAGVEARTRGLRDSARGARATTSPSGGGDGSNVENDADAAAGTRRSATKK